MIFSLNRIPKIIKKNTEVIFLFLLLGITIASTTFYNDNKIKVNENYKNIVNNIYFKKSINHIFQNKYYELNLCNFV